VRLAIDIFSQNEQLTKMVNETPPLNPLKAWRKTRGFSVAQCVDCSGITVRAWYGYESYPDADHGRWPNPQAWLHIRALTDDAVTPNHFSDLVREAA
jgi:hypothetical protein